MCSKIECLRLLKTESRETKKVRDVRLLIKPNICFEKYKGSQKETDKKTDTRKKINLERKS